MTNIAEFYNNNYKENYRQSLSGYEFARWSALNHFLSNVIKISSKDRILDYGTGVGLYVPLWQTSFPQSQLYFCDISTIAKAKFSEKYPRYENTYRIVHNDRADFPDEFFDVIVSVEVMEHVENLEAYLRDIARLLKPAGLFIWTTPCGNEFSIEHIYSYLFGKIEQTASGYRRWCWEDPTHVRRLKTREIKKLLEELGFGDVRFRLRSHLFSFLCTYFPPRGRLTRLRDKLMHLDYFLFRRLPNGASMIGVGRKNYS